MKKERSPLIEETIVKSLNYLLRTYDGLNKLIVSAKNRMASLNPEAVAAYQDDIKTMESLRGKFSRKIARELVYWPIWTEWMKHIQGIGPYIAGNLIVLYYYRFVAICTHCGADLAKLEDKDGKKTLACTACGKPSKSEGLLKHRIELKDFERISNWWSYMGQANGPDGKMIKKKKGVTCNFSPRGRLITYQIGEQFEKRSAEHDYRRFYDERKKKHVIKNADTTPVHRQRMARREAAKLFLAHFWMVARTIDKKTLTAPYAQTILGHTGIIDPFYWSQTVIETQESIASQKIDETQ